VFKKSVQLLNFLAVCVIEDSGQWKSCFNVPICCC